MRKRQFLGRETSVIAMGAGGFCDRYDIAMAEDLLDAYREAGGRLIDTAHAYGRHPGESERVVGSWLARQKDREEWFISTKGGFPPMDHMERGRVSAQELRQDLSEGLEALGMEQVDVFWLHRDNLAMPAGAIVEGVQGLLEDGWTRHVGVSNWTADRLREANDYARAHGLRPFCGTQTQFSLARQVYNDDPTLIIMDDPLWKLHREEHMACMAFSSQAKGFFNKLEQGGEAALSEKARRFLAPENLAVFERLRALSNRTGHSIGALALAWLTAQPFATIPIIGATRPGQLETLREAAVIELSDEERDALRAF